MRLTHGIRERKANRRRLALARAVWALPVESRRAMVSALDDVELIAGAYTDRRGRMCPGLAAFRHGARCGVGAFPQAWDDFARARRPRAATQRELEILRALLQESLAETVAPGAQPRSEPRPLVASA
jgi:hypothetical protein